MPEHNVAFVMVLKNVCSLHVKGVLYVASATVIDLTKLLEIIPMPLLLLESKLYEQ